MTTTVAREVAALPRLSVGQLQEKYAEVFGEPTTGRNKPWLVRRIAWRLQAKAEGGLSERVRRRAAELADETMLRLSPPATKPTVETLDVPASSDPRVPPPGTILTRKYKGGFLQVQVLAQGFAFAGETYPSLSAVAKAITGSHCNGFAFFKLASRKENR